MFEPTTDSIALQDHKLYVAHPLGPESFTDQLGSQHMQHKQLCRSSLSVAQRTHWWLIRELVLLSGLPVPLLNSRSLALFWCTVLR